MYTHTHTQLCRVYGCACDGCCVLLQHPELLLVSHYKKPASSTDPDGVALLWDLKYKKDTPDYIFNSQVCLCVCVCVCVCVGAMSSFLARVQSCQLVSVTFIRAT